MTPVSGRFSPRALRRVPAILIGAALVTAIGAGPAQAEANSETGCAGLVPATAAPISGHVEKAHLERSPMSQVHDLEQTSDYAAMHEAWIQAFTAPARDGGAAAAGATSTGAGSYAQKSAGSAAGASDPNAFALGATTGLQSVLQPGENLVVGGACSEPMAADHSMPPPSSSGDCSPGLADGTTMPIFAHFEKAHLQRSPAQQINDLQATDDYLLLHSMWIEMFTAPARQGLVHIADETPKPLFAHIQKAHMQRSPAQQAADLQATDDYLLLHTVWAGNILRPTIDVIDGSPCQ